MGKPHAKVVFATFVQTIGTDGAKAFEVLRQASEGGKRKCAAGPEPEREACQSAQAAFSVLEPGQSQQEDDRGNNSGLGSSRPAPMNRGQAVTLALRELIQHDRTYSFGVGPGMLENVVDGHQLDSLDGAWELLENMPRVVKDENAQCVPFVAGQHRLAQVRAYTDGTFDADRREGAWAVALCGESAVGKHWLGALSGL